MINKIIGFIKNNPAFIIIILTGTVLRLWKIAEYPPALNWDEVSHGYNAYSILKTGKDEWGNFFPLIFRAYGDYKLPVYIYLTAISEFFFGLTPFAVRIVSALSGIGTAIFTYFLCLELFSNYKNRPTSTIQRLLALTASLLVAIEPWSLFLSRAAFEANLALFFFVSGIYYFFKFLNSHTSYFILHTSVLFGLTVWTYNSYRIFTLLMLLVLIIIYRHDLIKLYKSNFNTVLVSFVLCALFFVPMLIQLASSAGQARYSWVQIIDRGMIAKIEEKRNLGGNRLVHNRATYFANEFGKNYISHFLPQFLFSRGGDNYQFSVPGKGLLFVLNLPFLFLGFLKVIKSKKRMDKLLIVWLLLAPIPSSLTREAPHVLRSVTFLPLPMIISALGLASFVKYYKKGIRYGAFETGKIYTGYVFIAIFFLINYLYGYFVEYPKKYSQSWQYGYPQVIELVKAKYKNYNKILVTKKYGEPHEFLLFYLRWDPNEYVNDPNLNRFYQSDWYWVDSFDKFYFVNDWEISENSEFDISRSIADENIFVLESGTNVNCHGTDSKCLLITSPGNHPDSWEKLDEINFLDGSKAFEIYEN